MNSLNVGDIVQNPIQRAIVRWIGLIEEISVIGLQLIDSTLPGYTDGACPYDNKHYFNCPYGQGYYVVKTNFIDSYKIIQKNTETSKPIIPNDQFKTTEQFLSTSPTSQPILSSSSPSVSQIQHNSDNNHGISSSRGVLSRLAFERKLQKSPSLSANKNLSSQSLSNEPDISPSRTYHPENYRSTSYNTTKESEIYEFTTYDDNNENRNKSSNLQIINNNNSNQLLSFGHEYYLNKWTFKRIKSLLENEIPIDNQFCLNICNNECNVQNLIDEQINGCLSLIPHTPPIDIRIELIKIYDNVEIVFLSRAIHLHDNDYLLLAILCSNSQCAYVRTQNGWAYTDDDSDNGQFIIVDEISQMIDESSTDIHYKSEQCLHVLKDASFLYYKLVE
ncbi:unnamed protein product [Adineta steineri]|uniref:CAP-Gly domain-containing protein n=1 Tax=Adineta steineri TaxID=433720 RepID=A0A818N7F5_9BILA|nr:unnamed protein product [Adineta steineri]